MQQNLHWFVGLASLFASDFALSQTTLPDVKVTAKWETIHRGYLISSNFEVDQHMSAVVYPAEPFQKEDIVAVKTAQMKGDEYLVLQECSSADCTHGHILRVWTAGGALGITAHKLDRVSIPHEGKYFLWMQRFPIRGYATGAFTGYEEFSPPLVLNPIGSAEQFQNVNVKEAQERGPVKVVSSDHAGSSFVIRFEGGTSVFVQRMHALESSK
jgi:hypothetical protein